MLATSETNKTLIMTKQLSSTTKTAVNDAGSFLLSACDGLELGAFGTPEQELSTNYEEQPSSCVPASHQGETFTELYSNEYQGSGKSIRSTKGKISDTSLTPYRDACADKCLVVRDLTKRLQEVKQLGNEKNKKLIEKVEKLEMEHQARCVDLKKAFEVTEEILTAETENLTKKVQEQDKEHIKIFAKLGEELKQHLEEDESREAAKSEDLIKRLKQQEKEYQATRVKLVDANGRATEYHLTAGDLSVKLVQVKADADDDRENTLRQITKKRSKYWRKRGKRGSQENLHQQIELLTLSNADRGQTIINLQNQLDDIYKEITALVFSNQQIIERASEKMSVTREQLDAVNKENSKLVLSNEKSLGKMSFLNGLAATCA